ncbi:MAG: CopD family protein [Rhodovibrionaceae bacterium]
MSGQLLSVALATALHALSATVWVGGMFLIYVCLRPAHTVLPPPERIKLMAGVFQRFFIWVWIAIVLLLASGYWIVFGAYAGFANAPLHIHIMQGTGLLMILIFLHLYFAPWKRMHRAAEAEDWAEAAKNMGQMRRIVAANLGLGLITAAIGASGRFWG